MTDRSKELEELRELMGTSSKREVKVHTDFVRGGERTAVELVGPRPFPNFYAGMYVMAVSTWGGSYDSGVEKWNAAPMSVRQKVVLAILQRKALPLALEYPTFLFEISGCSRSAFDQLARARIGATFASMGVRDNSHADADVVVPPKVYDDLAAMNIFQKGVEAAKLAYGDLLKFGQRSWQDARAVMPMGMMHRFCMSINYAALANMCSKRLMFCEQYDTVAVAWKLRQALGLRYALLGVALRPGCDFAKRCTYHEASSLGEAFGCLFAGCGRWPDPEPYSEFNESSADRGDIEAWLGRRVPDGADPINWDKALKADQHYFEEKL